MNTSKEELVTVLDLYQTAQNEVRAAGYDWEIEWQRSREFSTISESEFLREAAWVILCSGFKEAYVQKRFGYISLCFCDWESAHEIMRNRRACVATAMSHFRNERKLNAIAKIADILCEEGFLSFRRQLQEDPIKRLQELPFIGPVTSWHLAKNLGLNVAKNDRHLSRLAQRCGYSDAHSLCDEISALTGESISVVDIVLWRFAALFQAAVFSDGGLRQLVHLRP